MASQVFGDASPGQLIVFVFIPLYLFRLRLMADITIKGLAILCRSADCSGRPRAMDLEAYFASEVIGGPGSFVVTVDDQRSFQDAVRQKLLLEIAGLEPESLASR